jgi:hypothetical protein
MLGIIWPWDAYATRGVPIYFIQSILSPPIRNSKTAAWRMVSSGMLRRVALIRTDVSEELSDSFIRVTRLGELGKTDSCHSDEGALCSSETSVFTRATRRNIPEGTILHSHRRGNLKSYTAACILTKAVILDYNRCRTDISAFIWVMQI